MTKKDKDTILTDGEKMKTLSTIDLFRWCGFVILALVSLFFIYNLSITLAIEPIEKIAIVSGAIGLEFFKLFSIISATTYSYVGKQLGIKTKKRAFLYFTYIWVSLYSVLASFGYSVTAVDKMQTSIAVLNHENAIALENENIKNFNQNIVDYKNTKLGYENSKVSYINELMGAEAAQRDGINKKIADIDTKADAVQKKIDDQMAKKTASQDAIDNYEKLDLNASISTKRTMYDVIHDTIGWPARTIAFIILLIFSTSVELGIFTTAPHANRIDNMVVGEEETIFKKKRPIHNKKKETIKNDIEDITSGDGIVSTDVPESIDNTVSRERSEVSNPIEPKEVQKIKIESKAEEILQTLDDDRPAISPKVKSMAKSL